MSRLVKLVVLLVPLIWLGARGSDALAATCTSNAGAVNWNTAANWSCGHVPAAGDSVIIPNGSTVTLNVNTNTLASLQIDSGGTLTIGAGAAFDVYLGGNLVNNGTINFTVSASNNAIYLAGANVTSTFSGSGTWLLDRIDLNGAGGSACTGTCKVELSGSPNLQFNNATPLAGQSATNTFNALGNSTATVTLALAGNQAIATTGVTYPNLVLTGSGAKTPAAGTLNILGNLTLSGTATATTAGNLSVGGNLGVGSGTTLTVAGFNIAVTGTTSVSGTLTHSSATGTKTYTGNVTINNGGAWNETAAAAISFGGNLQNDGTLTASTGVHTFTGATKTLSGANAIVIPSVTISGAYQNNGTLTVATVLAVSGSLTNAGTVTATTALTGAGTLINGTGTAATLNIGFAGPPGITTLNASATGNTVNYNRAGNQTVRAVTYHDLTLSGSGTKTMTGVTTIGGDLTISGTATMTGNAGFTVAGAFSYASTGTTTLTAVTAISIGTFNQSAGTLADNGSTITVTGTGAGTWTKSAGTFTPTGTVIFTGAAPQIGASNFNNLTINVGAGNTATLTGNATVSGVLTLANGIVTTGANVLEVGSSCATGITRTGGYVSGNLSLHYPTLNPGTTTCTFPIGDATAYTPVRVAMANVSSSLANSILTARTDPGDHPDTQALVSGIDPGKSVNRYWTLIQGALLAFATYNATFTFVNGDIDNGANTANFIVGRKSGGVWTYPTMGAKNPNDTTATGISGFGVFAIGERAMPSITVAKSVTTYFDPVNGTTSPKSIPGAEMLYTITVTNSGPGSVDDGKTVITDSIPAYTSMCVSNACSNPVMTFTCSASPACGLTFTLGTSLKYSNNGGVSYVYTPVADSNGYDSNVTDIQITPSGTFNGAPSPQSTNFSVTFKIKIK